MATGLCSGCGTPAAVDAVFCAHCGASLGRAFVDLEPVGASAPRQPRSEQVVAAGRVRRAWWPFAVALVAVAALVGGAAALLQDGDAASPEGDATTPATDAPLAAPATEPVGVDDRSGVGGLFGATSATAGSLYVADGSLLKRVDLATGQVADLAAFGSSAVQLVAVDSGVFMIARDGAVYAVADASPGAPLLVGDGGYLVRSAAADSVWVSRDHACTSCPSTVWYEVDLAGKKTGTVEIARGVLPVAAAARGLVWQSPRGIYAARPKESPKLYANGTLIGAAGDVIVWFGCEDAAMLDCHYYVGDSSNAKARRLDHAEVVGRPSQASLERIGAFPLSTDLTTVAIPRTVDGRMPIVDLGTSEVRFVALGASVFRVSALSLTADGDWLVAYQGTNRTSLRAVNTRTGQSLDVVLPIESDSDVAIALR